MDAPDLDAWIEAQTPPVYERMQALSVDDANFDPRVIRRQHPHDELYGKTPSSAPGAEGEEDKTGQALTDSQSRARFFDADDMRLRAIHEAAVSYAAQTALAWRYEQLRELTQSHEDTLDVITSFAPFVQDEHMLLPSVTRVENRFDVSSDGSQLRSVNVQYQISEEPRAVTQPPTWRNYIWRQYPYPDEPHPALLPETDEEENVWKAGIRQGWRDGLRQAHNSWANNLNKLVRDIRGRITFRILQARGIVRSPEMHKGLPRMTTSDGGKTINAGEVVYSITVPLGFNDESRWNALWLPSLEATPEFMKPAESFGGQPVFLPSGDKHD